MRSAAKFFFVQLLTEFHADLIIINRFHNSTKYNYFSLF